MMDEYWILTVFVVEHCGFGALLVVSSLMQQIGCCADGETGVHPRTAARCTTFFVYKTNEERT